MQQVARLLGTPAAHNFGMCCRVANTGGQVVTNLLIRRLNLYFPADLHSVKLHVESSPVSPASSTSTLSDSKAPQYVQVQVDQVSELSDDQMAQRHAFYTQELRTHLEAIRHEIDRHGDAFNMVLFAYEPTSNHFTLTRWWNRPSMYPFNLLDTQ
jgi:hypothetical protein